MNYPRIIIAAPKSGSGKTTITCGLLRALSKAGLRPCSYKCGPDYIDPMFHRNVIGIPSGNLDTFFTDDGTTRSLFAKGFSGDIAVIEGVMGLYDGIGGVETQGSTYDLARVLQAPIVLVVDAKGAGRSILAQIKGFLDYDNQGLIKAVILNKASAAFGNTLGALIEKELNVKYLGTVPDISSMELSSRHLGLVMPEEVPELQNKLDELADLLFEQINIEEFKNIAITSKELDIIINNRKSESQNLRLAVARDRAFCFYYRENLEMLREAGVELVEFSPISDKALPENINGILLGGGYPENYLPELEANDSMKKSIKAAINNGMPVLAECGGFMYLCKEIVSQDQKSYSMAGVIDASAKWAGKLVRFGYITLSDEDISIKGHEFHYFDTDNNGDGCIATKPTGNRSWSCIHKKAGSYIGFPHLYYPSNPDFVNKFVEVMKNYG